MTPHCRRNSGPDTGRIHFQHTQEKTDGVNAYDPGTSAKWGEHGWVGDKFRDTVWMEPAFWVEDIGVRAP